MIKIIGINICCIFCSILLLSSKQLNLGMTDVLSVVAGRSKITGKIVIPDRKNNNTIFVNVTVSQPISGEYVKHKASVDKFGMFSVEVDVETNISLIGLSTSVNPEKVFLVKLISGGITNIEIGYDSNFAVRNIEVKPAINKNDMTEGLEIMSKMIEHRGNRAPQPLYNKSTDYFLNYAKDVLSERLEILKNEQSLSEELKGVLSMDFRLWLYSVHVFPYEKEMTTNYLNINGNKSENSDIQKIDRSYFRFLRAFNLNDPQYLQCFTFSEVQKEILQNENIGLPIIGESDIPSWLTSVKVILSDLVGFNNGPYYDLLAANAYARQLNEEVKPLTEKQKEHILNYLKNGEIAKILFRKNQKVIELNRLKSPVVLNDISSVTDDKVIETIISKYKGKVIFIDLWATWCAPCLDAMQEFRVTKNGLRDKNIAFVYLTNASSPRKLWEEKIKGIGDEQYYLTASQWYYVMDHFGFEAIPSYLLFDKEGLLINKFTAFPVNENVKKMIEALL